MTSSPFCCSQATNDNPPRTDMRNNKIRQRYDGLGRAIAAESNNVDAGFEDDGNWYPQGSQMSDTVRCSQTAKSVDEFLKSPSEADYFYYRGGQLVNIIRGQGQSQSGRRFFQTATGLAAQINVGENAGTWLIGSDALGSVLAGSDGKDMPEEHRYAPYGGEKHQESIENVMKLGYTGAYRDPLTGLYPLGNGYRLYLPELMCFNKADSLSLFGAGGINTRSYCTGDPINYSDPSGHVRKRS